VVARVLRVPPCRSCAVGDDGKSILIVFFIMKTWKPFAPPGATTPASARFHPLAWLMALTGAISAQAQTAASLQPVIVNANRYAQDVQSAPAAISVITGEQILAAGASDANDAIRKLLGIPYRTDLRGGRDYALDLRGFGATADQNVVVVVDGVRISENELASARLSAITPEMIESIEVVRGGSSVQWGEGASAGVINVVLKKGAKQGLSGSVTAQVESQAGHDLRADLRYGAGDASFDATLRAINTDGYRDNSHARQEVASFGVATQAGAWSTRLRVNSESDNNRFPGALSFAQFGANPRQTRTPNDYGDFKETRVTAGLGYRDGAWAFAVDLGGRDRDVTGFFTGFNSDTRSNSTQLSPKLTYTGAAAGGALTVVSGLDLIRWDYEATSNYGQNEKAHQSNDAWYLSADWLAPLGTRVNIGARTENVSKRADDPASFVGYNRADQLSAWDLGVSQALSAALNLYGRAAKAYRLPNVDENRYLFTALRPQITRDVEFGLKWQGGNGASASARVFRQNATDEIAYDPISFSNVNLDPTRRQGVVLEGRAQLAAGLVLSGSLQSVDAKFTQGHNNGREMPLVSKLSGVLRLAWAIDSRQALDVGWQHLGSARFGNDNDNKCANLIPSNALVDARYRWKQDQLELSLAATNLGDVKGYSQAYSCVSGSLYPDPGRTLKAAIKYSF
jgi:iron complex outermembrane receptor protein